MANPTTPPTPTNSSSSFLQDLAGALAGLGGALGGRAIANNSGNPLTSNVPPQLSQLLDIGVQRQAYSNPLYQATVQGSHAMLPTFAKEGTSLSGGLSNAIPTAPANSGGSNTSGGPGIKTGLSLATLGALLGGGNGGALPIQKIIDGIRKLFGHKNFGTTQPNTSIPSYDPFNSNGGNGWDLPTGNSPEPFAADPFANVNTDQFMGQWPETSTPFAPFDPSQLPGADASGGGGSSGGWWSGD